jgi:hypothetical protein
MFEPALLSVISKYSQIGVSITETVIKMFNTPTLCLAKYRHTVQYVDIHT